ncbi:MAG: biotin/lipoyl-binding protein [Xanthobacteraceae bacterium]
MVQIAGISGGLVGLVCLKNEFRGQLPALAEWRTGMIAGHHDETELALDRGRRLRAGGRRVRNSRQLDATRRVRFRNVRESAGERRRARADGCGSGRAGRAQIDPGGVEAIGTVSPIASVALKSRVETTIMQVHFEDGARVKAGDVLFTLICGRSMRRSPRPRARWRATARSSRALSATTSASAS